jgi:hypothetical protein
MVRYAAMIEVIKILASFLSGGLAGALLNEWFRRRREKVQRVQLIERVNRPVNPLVEGFTLARVGIGQDGTLEEVKDLREYQLTMRNSTSTHLENAEVQFEFPADDVQASISIPTLSRTPLVLNNAMMMAVAGKRTFRWTIPHFPAGDSVEFTFRAVAPSSEKYEAALYYTGVIFEKIVGEPPPTKKVFYVNVVGAILGIVVLVLVVTAAALSKPSSGEKLTVVELAGCNLQVVSIFEVYGTHVDSPWHIKHRIFNIGTQDCVIQSQALNLGNPTTVKPGDALDREYLSERAPKLVDAPISIGAAGTSRATTSIPIYAAH